MNELIECDLEILTKGFQNLKNLKEFSLDLGINCLGEKP